MEKKSILFFEITDYALGRFPKWLTKSFSDQSQYKFIYIYLDTYNKSICDFSWIPNGSETINLNGKVKNINPVLENNNDGLLFTFAVRPPEFYVVHFANGLGIKTHIFQHGIFIPFMKKELSYFFRESNKMISYFKSIYFLSKISSISLLDSFLEIYNIYILGSTRISQSKFMKLNVLPSKAFVYSHYWGDYFTNNYGFSQDQFIYTGTPDLSEFYLINNQNREDAICYVCQTLVEDGRLTKKEFNNFINILRDSLSEEDLLYIKLHPRSDLS
ncbi:polysialyltransferase family glycosyltransferase, partial [Zhouia amylolytica]|uniref:polysialyltransferase family glycosyltransferase n=1 Tax=Zhouia amylolytica TaxID=376730 RepID=UPI0020CFAA14